MKKKLLLSKLQISYYPEPDSHIRYEVKVVLDLTNYDAKKELEHVTDADATDLAAKKDFIGLKAEVEKLHIAKLANISTSLNNF